VFVLCWEVSLRSCLLAIWNDYRAPGSVKLSYAVGSACSNSLPPSVNFSFGGVAPVMHTAAT
jgi:hypothetical protein